MFLFRLARERKFDYLVIESSGISEPLPVAETFTFDDDEGTLLRDFATLDTTVTVVDTFNFMRDFKAGDTLQERKMSAYEGDERAVVDL